jgi:hypothetical protein
MKTIRFTSRPTGYGCSEPGEQAGEYVRAEVARDLLAACHAALKYIDSDDATLESRDNAAATVQAAITKATTEARDVGMA